MEVKLNEKMTITWAEFHGAGRHEGGHWKLVNETVDSFAKSTRTIDCLHDDVEQVEGYFNDCTDG